MKIAELEIRLKACEEMVRSCEASCESALVAICNVKGDNALLQDLFVKTKGALAKAKCEYYEQKGLLEQARNGRGPVRCVG